MMIVDTGIALPYSPFTMLFGFVPLPAPVFVFLAISTVTYLALVQLGQTHAAPGMTNSDERLR
jgi:Mg2+-importing ATPase